MGLFSSVGDALGLGGPDLQDPTTQERSLLNQATQRFDRAQDFFRPLQRRFERQAEQSQEDFFRGRANADTFQNIGNIAVDANGEVQNTGDQGVRALARGFRAGSNQDENRTLQQRTNALNARAGQGQAAIQGLDSAAETATRRTIADLERDIQENRQKQERFGALVGAGAALGGGSGGGTPTLGGGQDAFGNFRPIGTGGDLLQTEPTTGIFNSANNPNPAAGGGGGFSLSSLFGG